MVSGMTGPERLQKWREKKELSQEQVALLVGVKQTTISRWEAGESHPILKFAIRLAKVSKGAVPVEAWSAESRSAA